MLKQKVVINVCTCKRPKMLMACIESILKQSISDEWSVELQIVDNDPDSTLYEDLSKFIQTGTAIIIHYAHEKTVGIPYARNTACKLSLEHGADWIIFIDDDEMAEPNWLIAYYQATKQYDAEAYSGPVKYDFPDDYAEWLGNKGDLDTKDGTIKKRASTNNALIHSKLVSQSGYGLQFDTRMTFTGGSDTDFFMRFVKMGGKIVHVSQALVAEKVTANRLKISWRLKRQYRSSTNRVYINKKLLGINKAIFMAIKESIRHLVEGCLSLLICWIYIVKGKNSFKRQYYHSLRHLAKGFGNFSGIFGIQPQPYKSIDGQ